MGDHRLQGHVLRTDRRTQILADQRFTWQEAGGDGITVYWVEGDAAFGDTLLDLARASAELLQAEAGLGVSDPVRLVIYPDFEPMREAVLQVAEWTGGLAYPHYNAILIGIAPDQEDWAKTVIPHEFTHLVTGAATANCLGVYMPTWLNEGLSMHFEHTLGEYEDRALRDYVVSGELPPLRELANGFSAYSDAANLSYTQSGRVVTYLLETYGPERMSALLGAFQQGQTADAALVEVYGLDTDGIDAAWRAHLLGEPSPTPQPLVSPSPQPTQTAVPTIVAWNGVPTPFVVTPLPTAAAPTVTATPTPAPSGASGAAGVIASVVLLATMLILCGCTLVPGAAILGGALWLILRGSRE